MVEAAETALLGGDPAAFESLVLQLMSPENNARQAAESSFQKMKETVPELCVVSLVRVLRQSPQPDSRTFCAVLLRRVLTKEEPSLWPKIASGTQVQVRQQMLSCIKDETMRSITKKVCDTVSELAAVIMREPSGWPELLPFMSQAVQSGQPLLMEAALLVFAQLAGHMMPTLLQYMGTLHQVLHAALGNDSVDVRLAAMRATTAFIMRLELQEARDAFQATTPLMLSTIGFALNAGEETAAQEALEMFIEVAEEHPRFLRRQLQDIVTAMLQIAGAEALDCATRQLAAEFLITLCEARDKAPGMMRKLPSFSESIFQIMMSFLLDIEDVEEWHRADCDTFETEGEGELYEFGQECLDRLALSLGGKTLMPLAISCLPPMLASKDWKQRHAALIALAQIAEGCIKTMLQHLESLVAMCLQGLQDPQPHVRWAACQALGQMCTDLGPDLQDQQHAAVLPGLLAAMDDFNAPRVQAHASAAVVNFSENCDQDLLPPYLDTLISKLLTLLQRGQRTVQEGALTAMASVADCAKAAFERYYDSVMPLLRTALTSEGGDKQQTLLRAKALECISLVGMAVGKERFREDAHQVMRFMKDFNDQPAGSRDADDPMGGYMLQAGARICKVLGQDFLPYMDIVMPPLLEAAQLKPDVNISDVASDVGDDEDGDDEVETIYLGDRRIQIRTSVLEDKCTACNMLCCYADELKHGFLPWVQQVTSIMVPLLKFYFHEDVRIAAVQSLPELLRSAVLAVEVGLPSDPTLPSQLLDFVWNPLLEALQKEPDVEVLVSMLTSIEELLGIGGPDLISMERVGQVLTAMQAIVKSSEERRTERGERTAAEDFDEEEAEALEEENEAEEEILDGVASIVGVALRKWGDAAMPLVDPLMPAFGDLVTGKLRTAGEKRIGVCFMDDVIEHAPAAGAQYVPQILGLLVHFAQHKDPDLKQAAVYGLGVAAVKRQEAFRPIASQVAASLIATLAPIKERTHGTQSSMCNDNVVSALGKIVELHGSEAEASVLEHQWLPQLPLCCDEVEAMSAHEQLVRLLEASDRRVLGDQNSTLPHIISVFATVLSRGTDLASEDTVKRMALLIQQMRNAMTPQVFNSLVAQMTPKQQAAMARALQGTGSSLQ